MGSGSEFNFAEFGEFLLELLASALWGLYMIFSYIFKEIAGVIGKYIIPVLPSRVRLLQDNNISAGILIAFVIYVLYIPMLRRRKKNEFCIVQSSFAIYFF